LARPFTVEGVLVTWPRAFGRALRASGPLRTADRVALASSLDRAFPPHTI
jgi:hypothetical protein